MTTPQKTFASGDNAFKFTVKASTIPQYRTDRLVSYLTTVCGLKDVWQTKNLQPLLNRWMGKKDFLAVCRKAGVLDSRLDRLASLLTHLHRHQVKDWVAEVAAKAAEGIVEEGSPEQELADEADYWASYVPKFGKEVFRLRAIKWEGVMMFMVDDVAKMYGGVYLKVPVGNFVTEVVGCMKKHAIKKLTYQEILAASPSSEKDKATMKKGKYFVDRKTMLRVLAKSSKPSAEAFVEHLIDVLDGKTETLAAFKERKVATRASEEILDEDSNVLHACRRISKERSANPRAMVGQATVGFLGEKLADFAERHGVKRPHRKNVILEMPDVGDGISSSVRLGNHLTKNSASCVGEVLVGRAYYVAGALTRKNSELDISRAEHLLAAMDKLTLRRALPK